MEKPICSSYAILIPLFGGACLLAAACSGESQPAPSADNALSGYPLARNDPRAILDIDPADYPEAVAPAPRARATKPKAFGGMTFYDLRTGFSQSEAPVRVNVPPEQSATHSTVPVTVNKSQPARLAPAAPDSPAPTYTTLDGRPADPKEGIMGQLNPSVLSTGAEMIPATHGLMAAKDRERDEAVNTTSADGVGRTVQAYAARIDSTTWAARVNVKLFTQFPSGYSSCSGTLISRRTVLTAGHCLKYNSNGGQIVAGRAVPGLDGTYMPFGDARIASVFIDTNWAKSEDNDDDWALAYLDRDIGDVTGTFGVSWQTDSQLSGKGVSYYGYPVTIGNGLTLSAASGNVTCTDEWGVFYSAAGAPGFSGAGVTYAGGSNVIAINRGTDYNLWCSTSAMNAGTRVTYDRSLFMITHLDQSTSHLNPNTHWSGLGGLGNTQVTGVSWGTGRNDLFVRGTDAAAYHKWEINGSFAPSGGGWDPMGGQIIGKIAATSRGVNLLDLFVRSYASPGQVCTMAFNGTSWWPSATTWSCFSDFLINGSPTAISSSPSRLHVFGRGGNGHVLVKDWTQSGGWAAPTDLGGNTNEDIAAVSRGTNLWDIFIRDAGTGTLCTKSWNNGTLWPTGTTWFCFSNAIASAPVVVAPDSNSLDVFYTAWNSLFDNTVGQWSFRNGSWSGPFNLGGSSSNTIAAVSRPFSNRSELFVIGSDGAVYTKSYYNGGWTPSQTDWTPLGGDMLDVTALSSGSARIDLVARARSLEPQTRYWNNSGWSN